MSADLPLRGVRVILAVLGGPNWAQEPEFQNPFELSEDDSRVGSLLDAEPMKYDRNQLHDRAAATGAPFAPVLSLEEARGWDVFGPGFFDEAGWPRSPFPVRRAEATSDE